MGSCNEGEQSKLIEELQFGKLRLLLLRPGLERPARRRASR